MAVYKVSTKNKLGYKNNIFPTLILASLVSMFFGLIISAFTDKETGDGAVALLYIVVPVVYRYISVKKGRWAPLFFTFSDPMLPKNDTELWATSTFAIQSNAFPELEGWPLVSGAHTNRKAVRALKNSIEQKWDVQNGEDGIKAVHKLTDAHVSRRGENAGWGLCRANCLVAMLYGAGYITRQELSREFERISRLIQSSFGSWEEMCESYLAGYAAWQGSDTEGVRNSSKIRASYEDMQARGFGPYTVPWELNLTEASETDILTKHLLRGYDPFF